MTTPIPQASKPQSGKQTTKPTTAEFSASVNISDFQISPADFLASRPDIHNIIAGAMVFRTSPGSSPVTSAREILLLQRAASDSFPLKWEIPAGTADPAIDHSIVEVAVRELWEETGLQACRLHQTVGLGLPPGATSLAMLGEVEDARMDAEHPLCLLRVAGQTWAVVTFLVDVQDEAAELSLQESEHVRWAWLTEDEVQAGCFRDRPGESLTMVSEAMKLIVLEGFRLMKTATT